jgi:hypothetical protein
MNEDTATAITLFSVSVFILSVSFVLVWTAVMAGCR